MFVVAIRTQAPPGVREGAGHVFAEDSVGEGSGTRRDDDATTDGETRADNERGARKRTLDDVGGTRRAGRGATRGGNDGGNDGDDDTRATQRMSQTPRGL